MVSIPILTIDSLWMFLDENHYCASLGRKVKPALQFDGYLPVEKHVEHSGKWTRFGVKSGTE